SLFRCYCEPRELSSFPTRRSSDLRGIDLVKVVNGDGPPPILVVSVIRGLPDTSRTAALASGGYEFLGWGGDRYALAAIYDAINSNTIATGNFKKKPKVDPFPRPKKKSKKKRTVADLHRAAMERQQKR